MRLKLQQRDLELLELLKNCKCADTTSISNIFFNGSLRAAQNRLKKLQEAGELRAYRENILAQNVYYTNRRPTNIKHAIKVTQFIAELHKLGIEIIKYKVPYKLANIIADGLLVVKVNGEIKILFLEVELMKYFNLSKYQELYYSRAWKDVFPVFPTIIVVTDKKVELDKTFNIIKIKTDFSNIQDLILNI